MELGLFCMQVFFLLFWKKFFFKTKGKNVFNIESNQDQDNVDLSPECIIKGLCVHITVMKIQKSL